MRPPSHVVPSPATGRYGVLASAVRAAWDLATPFVEVDPAGVVERCAAVGAALGVARTSGVVRHVVATAADGGTLARLAARGADFEVSTPREARAVLAAGATPDDLTYSGSVAHHARVADVAGLGVRLFVVRTIAEVDDVVASAPGTAVVCRLAGPRLHAGQARRRANLRQGQVGQAVEVLRHAAECGLGPAGIAVELDRLPSSAGSCTDDLLDASARVFELARSHGLRPWLLSVTAQPGALPSDADEAAGVVHSLTERLSRSFGPAVPRLSLAAGSWLADGTATLVASVVAVTWHGSVRRVVLDASPYPAAAGGCQRDEVRVESSADETGPAGPCLLTSGAAASDGVVARLPVALRAGDVVRVAGVSGPSAWRGVSILSE